MPEDNCAELIKTGFVNDDPAILPHPAHELAEVGFRIVHGIDFVAHDSRIVRLVRLVK